MQSLLPYTQPAHLVWNRNTQPQTSSSHCHVPLPPSPRSTLLLLRSLPTQLLVFLLVLLVFLLVLLTHSFFFWNANRVCVSLVLV